MDFYPKKFHLFLDGNVILDSARLNNEFKKANTQFSCKHKNKYKEYILLDLLSMIV
mgnify:CR=1 FL=1|jgi:hypothetical protein